MPTASIRKLAVSALGVSTFGVFGVALAVHRAGKRQPLRNADALVVLGAKVFADGRPSPALVARVDAAARLFAEGLAPRVVFSGGSRDGAPAEAEVALQLALKRGVPRTACTLEAESQSTADNARLSAPLLAPGQSVILVSDPFHLLRAKKLFRRAGIADVQTAPASYAGREFGRLDAVYWTTREALAVAARPALWFA